MKALYFMKIFVLLFSCENSVCAIKSIIVITKYVLKYICILWESKKRGNVFFWTLLLHFHCIMNALFYFAPFLPWMHSFIPLHSYDEWTLLLHAFFMMHTFLSFIAHEYIPLLHSNTLFCNPLYPQSFFSKPFFHFQVLLFYIPRKRKRFFHWKRFSRTFFVSKLCILESCLLRIGYLYWALLRSHSHFIHYVWIFDRTWTPRPHPTQPYKEIFSNVLFKLLRLL